VYDIHFSLVAPLYMSKELILKQWISKLRGLDHCPECIVQFLDLIASSLLVPDATTRENISRIHVSLTRISERCSESEDYCIRRPAQAASTRKPSYAQPAVGALRVCLL
jgi:hypothetical protein